MAFPEASVSTTNGREKLGKRKTRVVVRVCFNFVKTSRAFISHVNVDNHSKFMSGEARVANPQTNF